MPAAVSPLLRQYSRAANPNPPTHLGTRYDTAGTFLPEPGNTVVCHLEAGSPTEMALIDARSRFLAMPESGNLAFTPISSLHMPLFQGIIEGRRAVPYWPAEVPTDTPIAEMTRLMLERLAPYAGGPPFKVEVTDALPTGLKLEGATAADRQALRDWRDAFAAILGYRHPDHDD